jgi:hypothetical protein
MKNKVNYCISTEFAGYGHRKVILHTWDKRGQKTERSFVTNDTEITDLLQSEKTTEVRRAEIYLRKKIIKANKK